MAVETEFLLSAVLRSVDEGPDGDSKADTVDAMIKAVLFEAAQRPDPNQDLDPPAARNLHENERGGISPRENQ